MKDVIQSDRKTKKKWQIALASFGSIGVALLPKIGCPACWPAYAGVLSSLGIPFVNYTPYLMPLLSIFLAIALFSLGFHARRRRGYMPFRLGILAAAIIMVGKFVFDFDQVMYGGIALLMFASIWNSWPLKKTENAHCPACESTITTAGETK